MEGITEHQIYDNPSRPPCFLPSLTSITPFLSSQLWPYFGCRLNLGQKKTPQNSPLTVLCSGIQEHLVQSQRKVSYKKGFNSWNQLGTFLEIRQCYLPILYQLSYQGSLPFHKYLLSGITRYLTRFWNYWHNKFSPQKSRGPHAREQRSLKNNCKSSQGI